MNPPDLPDCVAEISHGIKNWLRWKLYKGSEGHLLLNVTKDLLIGDPTEPLNLKNLKCLPHGYIMIRQLVLMVVNPSYDMGVGLAPPLPCLDHYPIHDKL